MCVPLKAVDAVSACKATCVVTRACTPGMRTARRIKIKMTKTKTTRWGQGHRADRTVGATAALSRVAMVMVAMLAADAINNSRRQFR